MPVHIVEELQTMAYKVMKIAIWLADDADTHYYPAPAGWLSHTLLLLAVSTLA